MPNNKLINIFDPNVDEISQGFTINSWHVLSPHSIKFAQPPNIEEKFLHSQIIFPRPPPIISQLELIKFEIPPPIIVQLGLYLLLQVVLEIV